MALNQTDFSEEIPPSGPTLTVARVIAIARENLKIVAAGGLLGLAVGGYFVSTLVPTYTASATLMVDNRKVRAVEDAYVFANNIGDSLDSDLASQIELFRSDRITALVVDRMMKNNSQETYLTPTPGIQRWLSEMIRSFDAAAANTDVGPKDVELERRYAIDRVKEKTLVRRVQRAPVLEVSYTSLDPKVAALYANALIDAYMEDQLDAQRHANNLAASWLRDQLSELKDLLRQSEQAVQSYRANSGMVASEPAVADGKQLSEAATQLAILRSDIKRGELRLAKLENVIASGDVEASLSDVGNDPIMMQLRSRFTAASRGEHFLVGRVQPTHAIYQRLNEEKAAQQQLMLGELERIAATQRNELEVSKARAEVMDGELQRMYRENLSKSSEQIGLRDLERTNEAYKKIYAALLERNQEALQQLSFANRNVRVIATARTPTHSNGPSSAVYLALSLAGGLMCGVGAAGVRAIATSERSPPEAI